MFRRHFLRPFSVLVATIGILRKCGDVATLFQEGMILLMWLFFGDTGTLVLYGDVFFDVPCAGLARNA